MIENANRIKNATDDIREWIEEQGVTPTGNIDTFRDALDQIPTGGGRRCMCGQFNTVAGADVYVECGFEPSMIMVSSMPAYGAVASTDTSVYVKSATLEKHSFYRTSANALTQENSTNANLRFTVDTNGFNYRSRFTKTNVYYMAIE